MLTAGAPRKNGDMSKYICIFCDERKHVSDAYAVRGKIGICPSCRASLADTSKALPFKGYRNISYVMSAFEYTGKLRDVILSFKFKNCWSYAPLLADIMQEYISSYGDISETFDCIVPVPLHSGRMRERGYNQSELIAEHVAKRNGIPMRPDLLVRNRATVKQSTLHGTSRALNVKDAFECGEPLDGANVLIFDDICTTGSTLRFCADALKRAGAEKICALTLAIHVQDKLPMFMY